MKRWFGIDPVHHRTLNPDCREPGLFGTGKIREGEIVAEGVVIAVVDDDDTGSIVGEAEIQTLDRQSRDAVGDEVEVGDVGAKRR